MYTITGASLLDIEGSKDCNRQETRVLKIRGSNLTTDNYYTTWNLAKWLYDEKAMTMISWK